MDKEKSRVLACLFGFGDDGAHPLPVGDDMAVDDFVVGGAGVAGFFDEGSTYGQVFAFAIDVEGDVLSGGGFSDELVDFWDGDVAEF